MVTSSIAQKARSSECSSRLCSKGDYSSETRQTKSCRYKYPLVSDIPSRSYSQGLGIEVTRPGLQMEGSWAMLSCDLDATNDPAKVSVSMVFSVVKAHKVAWRRNAFTTIILCLRCSQEHVGGREDVWRSKRDRIELSDRCWTSPES